MDTTPPALSLPSGFTVEATGAGGARVTYATALDVVDGTVAFSCTPASGGTFALGDTGVSCSAADAAGNPATGGFTVSVQDHTPPGLHLPDPVTAEATGPAGAVVNYTAGGSPRWAARPPTPTTTPGGPRPR